MQEITKYDWYELEKEIEAKRKEKVSPFNETLDAINAFFKNYREKVITLKKDVASKIDIYRTNERRKAEELAQQEEERLKKEREEQRRKELAEAKKEGTAPPPIAPKIEPVKPVETVAKSIQSSVGKSTERITWKFEIVDANKIPREYMIPDEMKIRGVVKVGIREIPGVRIYEHRETVFSK